MKCKKCDNGIVENTGVIKPIGPPIEIYCCKECLQVYHKYNTDGELECTNYKHNYWDNIRYPKTKEDLDLMISLSAIDKG